MTSWKEKFEGIPTCNSALYWHQSENELDNEGWTIVRIYRDSDGSLEASFGIEVNEKYPNGPRCLRPDDQENFKKKVRREAIDECIRVLQERLKECPDREEYREISLQGWQKAIYALCEEVAP